MKKQKAKVRLGRLGPPTNLRRGGSHRNAKTDRTRAEREREALRDE